MKNKIQIWIKHATGKNELSFYTLYTKYGKGKAIPLQAWTGPKGSGRLRFRDFKAIGT
jgi:hypothetical protein